MGEASGLVTRSAKRPVAFSPVVCVEASTIERVATEDRGIRPRRIAGKPATIFATLARVRKCLVLSRRPHAAFWFASDTVTTLATCKTLA